MVVDSVHRELPSYFMECLAYNCPDSVFTEPTWIATIRGMLGHLWTSLQGEEPTDSSVRWLEANACFYLFHDDQKRKRSDGREFAHAAWNYLGFT